ncbi:unnamed protein product [Pylaiella littoralis]
MPLFVNSRVLKRAVPALMAALILTLVGTLPASDVFPSNGNTEHTPAYLRCYETEGNLFACHAMGIIAASSPTLVSPAKNRTDGLAAKEMRMQDARSSQLYQAGSTVMTSRIPVFGDYLAPDAASPMVAIGACHPEASDAMDIWDEQWEMILNDLEYFAHRPSSPADVISAALRETATATWESTHSLVRRWLSRSKVFIFKTAANAWTFLVTSISTDLDVVDVADDASLICDSSAAKEWLGNALERTSRGMASTLHSLRSFEYCRAMRY